MFVFTLSCDILFDSSALGDFFLHFSFECFCYRDKVQEDFPCNLISFFRCLWASPLGAPCSDVYRFSPFLSPPTLCILPLLTFLRITPPFSWASTELQMPQCPGVHCFSTSVFSISSLLPLSSHYVQALLCSPLRTSASYILMCMKITWRSCSKGDWFCRSRTARYSTFLASSQVIAELLGSYCTFQGKTFLDPWNPDVFLFNSICRLVFLSFDPVLPC